MLVLGVEVHGPLGNPDEVPGLTSGVTEASQGDDIQVECWRNMVEMGEKAWYPPKPGGSHL
jgi:hypothetical protein